MASVKLEIYGQSVKIIPLDPFVKSCALEFCRSMIKYKTERVVDTSRPGYHAQLVKVPDCTFAAAPVSREFFCVHRGQLDEFKGYLARCGIGPSEIELVDVPQYEPTKANLVMKPGWVPKPNQEPVIDYIIKDGNLKILPIQTGFGKTFVALYAAAQLGLRLMLVTRGGYIDKWIEDVKKTYDIDDDRILVVKGEKALIRAIEKAKSGDFDYDVLLVSTGGMSDYIKHYEQYHGTELGEHFMDPRAIGMLFGVGLRVVDEAHQMLHAYYRIDLYSHFNKVLFLSATILANDALEQRVHEIIYPLSCRYLASEWKCYITATSLRYNLAEPHKARFKDHRKNYSHVIYEQYLMRNKEKLKHYLNMVANLTNDFLKHRLDGQKYLIFASTVDMCDIFVNDLKKRFPNVIIGRYVAEDKLEDIYGYDVIVTTPGSGGTGIDIPDLAKALATCAVSSAKLNVQMLGRLRELKNYPGEEPEYQYLVCYDIPKQVEYHKQKLELFKGKVKNHREQNTGVLV